MTKIEIVGKFYDQHSLARINRNIAIELDKFFDVFVTPTDTFDQEKKVNKKEIRQIKNLEIKNNNSEIDIQVRHSYPPIWRWPVSEKTKIVFIQPWEFCKIPFEWQYKWETFGDALIVPSTWERNMVLDAGIKPEEIYVVPNGYNPDIFNTKKEDVAKKNKFTFTYVGNSQYRKGIDILLNAWAKAFVKADNVQLIVKDSPEIYGKSALFNEIIKMQYKARCGEVIYINDNLTDEEIANIYKYTRVLLHPFRGEGFGMHIQEAMACGAFPIITQGGAPGDFVTNECGWFIQTSQNLADLTSPQIFATKPGDSLTGMGAHAWTLEPNMEDLKRKMQIIYNHHEQERIFDGLKTSKLFTWNYVGEIYKNVLNKIQEEIKTPKRIR